MRRRVSRARRWIAVSVALGAVLVVAGCRGPDNGQNSLQPDGPDARTIDNLFVPVFFIAVVVGVFVLAGTLFVAIRFRARPGKNENPKQIHGSTPLEIGWTIVPALILLVVAVFTIRTIFDLAREPKGDVLQVTTVGKQWWWQFNYPDEEIVTANELVIPTDTQVRVKLTACDDSLPGECNVIHSFWVPELAGKMDVIPGRDNATTIEADDPGTYLGQCAEYCGLSHANMRFRVIAKEPADFEQWVEEQQAPPAVPFQGGPDDAEPAGPAQALVLEKYQCANCHSFDNPGASTYGPNLAHFASRSTFASGYYELTRERLVEWLLDAPSLIPMESQDCREPGAPAVEGGTCVGMPSFTKDGPGPVMSQADAEQIADYLLSLR
ncbi:MAG: cytochrome c oxidase subunit II [Acidimicrobiia bacterium]